MQHQSSQQVKQNVYLDQTIHIMRKFSFRSSSLFKQRTDKQIERQTNDERNMRGMEFDLLILKLVMKLFSVSLTVSFGVSSFRDWLSPP